MWGRVERRRGGGGGGATGHCPHSGVLVSVAQGEQRLEWGCAKRDTLDRMGRRFVPHALCARRPDGLMQVHRTDAARGGLGRVGAVGAISRLKPACRPASPTRCAVTRQGPRPAARQAPPAARHAVPPPGMLPCTRRMGNGTGCRGPCEQAFAELIMARWLGSWKLAHTDFMGRGAASHCHAGHSWCTGSCVKGRGAAVPGVGRAATTQAPQ
jgi:hypothetical protein